MKKKKETYPPQLAMFYMRPLPFREPTWWEKFVYGDADYAPWKRRPLVNN